MYRKTYSTLPAVARRSSAQRIPMAAAANALMMFLAVGLGGCANVAPKKVLPQATSHAEVPVQWKSDGSVAAIDRAGKLRGYVESSRATDFCPPPGPWGADQRCTVTRGWDYGSGVNRVRTYSPTGELLSDEIQPGADLSLLPIEQARVEQLMRADPRLASVVNRPGVRVWGGGFVFREPGDPHCSKHSRCIRAIAAANDGDDVVAHAVVDLMTDRIVYPFYQPAAKSLAPHPQEK